MKALLTTDGASYISNADITTDAAGGAGIFAYGDGTVYAADSTIATKQNTSGGIHVAGGGTLYAWDLDVTTDGESAAAIRSDRGGGTMVVDGGTYTSNGVGSPAVYCTADIAVNDATLTANGSEAICSDVDITYADDSEFFLMCTGNTNERGWGTAGANGSQCNFTADDQKMQGNVIWDSTVTNLYNEGTITDADGNTVSVVGTDGTVYVKGTSAYTITVESYGSSADLSGATQTDSWSSHEVAKPEEL